MTSAHKMVDGVKVPLTPQEIAQFKQRDDYFESVTKPAQQAAVLRQQELTRMTKELSDVLTKSPAQIDNWFAANVITPAQTIHVLNLLAKIVALRL